MIGLNLNTRRPLSGASTPPAPWWQTLYPQSALAADFANNRAMMQNTSADFSEFLTITRNSQGYAENTDGSLILYNNNELRISDQGVLIESARTNTLVDSENLGSANWTALGSATIASSSQPSPDPAKTAHLVQNLSSAGDGVEYTDPLSTSIANKVFTFSVYVRTPAPSELELEVGSISGSAGSSTLTINTDTNWKRFSLTHSYSFDSSSAYIRITRTSAGAATTFHAWGAQLEQGSYATSTIPSNGTPATRSTDNIHFSNLNWLDPTQGTLLLTVQSNQPAISNRRLLGFASAQGLETAPNQITIENWNGSSLMQAHTGGTNNWNTGVIAGFSWNSVGRSLCIDGGEVATDDEGPGAITTINLGSRDGTSSFWEGYFRTLVYFDIRKSDNQLQVETG